MKLKKESKEVDLVIKSEVWSDKDLADFRTLMQKIKLQNKNNSARKAKSFVKQKSLDV